MADTLEEFRGQFGRIYLTRFCGPQREDGRSRVCLQITVGQQYVSLTRAEAFMVAARIFKHFILGGL